MQHVAAVILISSTQEPYTHFNTHIMHQVPSKPLGAGSVVKRLWLNPRYEYIHILLQHIAGQRQRALR